MAEAGRPARRMRSIRARVTAGAVLVLLIALAAGALGMIAVLDASLTAGVADRVESELETIADGLDDGTLSASDLAERDDDVLIALRADVSVANDEDAWALSADGDDPVEQEIDGERFLVAAEETDDGLLVVGCSLEEAEEAVGVSTWILAVGVPAAVVVMGVVVWVVAARSLAPVERMRRLVDGIDATALDRRIPPTGNGDEIDRLAATMNRLLSRIEHAYDMQRRFASDASHELRSPLASIRQHAELSLAHPESISPVELADVVIDEGARMQEIVESLLLLTRLDEGAAASQPSPVDLDDVALTAVSRMRGVGAHEVEAAIAPVRVAGDERLLERAVRNLADNAVRHARSRVVVTVERAGDRALLHVDDDGHGIRPEDRERVLDRFTRLDEARAREEGGSGLGLAIVREIARASGGSVRVADAPIGGARLTLDLPALPG